MELASPMGQRSRQHVDLEILMLRAELAVELISFILYTSLLITHLNSICGLCSSLACDCAPENFPGRDERI